MSRFDVGGLFTGLFFTVMGVAFVLESNGVWTFRLSQLAVLGPVLLILVGLVVLVRSLTRFPAGGPGS